MWLIPPLDEQGQKLSVSGSHQAKRFSSPRHDSAKKKSEQILGIFTRILCGFKISNINNIGTFNNILISSGTEGLFNHIRTGVGSVAVGA